MAEPERLFGTSLAAALQRESDVARAVHAASLQEALHAVRDCSITVALIASALPPQGAAASCRRLHEARPDLLMLVMSGSDDPQLLLDALEAGAQGLLNTESRLADVLAGVRALLRGEAVVPRRMLGGLLHELIQRKRHDGTAVERYARLSRREREVLSMLGRGLDHDGIARALVISPQTARTHIQNVMSKLEVHSRVEAATFAVNHGFTEDAR